MFSDKKNLDDEGDSLEKALLDSDLLGADDDLDYDLTANLDYEDIEDLDSGGMVEFTDEDGLEDIITPVRAKPESKTKPMFSSESSVGNFGANETPKAQTFIPEPTPERKTQTQPQVSANYKNNARKLTEALSDESSEIHMNGPTEILQKKEGGIIKLDISFANIFEYNKAIDEVLLAYVQGQPKISDHVNYIEGILFWNEDKTVPPVVARVHVVLPPAARCAQVTVAKKARWSLSLDDLVSRGSLSPNMSEFIKSCARGQVNILLSGVSGSGKTTLLEAIAEHFDANDRVVVIEDTSELQLDNAFDVSYLEAHPAAPGKPKSEEISLEWLVRQANRMRPSRIIIGELRGAEASEFLIAANSGADGSMTTIHAENPRRALSQILNLALKSGGNASERTVKRDISETLQIVIQASLIDGKHIISSIEEISSTIREQTGAMTSQTIFSYDKLKKRFVANSRPTEELTNYMAHRGETVNNEWFK